VRLVGKAEIVRGNALEHLGLLPPPVEFRGRGAAAPSCWKDVLKHHHPPGIRIRERLQQDRVHHREDRCVRRDRKRQGCDCRRREARRLPQNADRMPEVLQKSIHTRYLRTERVFPTPRSPKCFEPCATTFAMPTAPWRIRPDSSWSRCWR